MYFLDNRSNVFLKNMNSLVEVLMNKKKAQRIHAKRRALERYGLEVTEEVRDNLKSKVARGDGVFLYRTSRRVSVWELTLEGNEYRIAYDKNRKEIITFLPNDQRRPV